MEEEISLSTNEFKALSSKTRTNILKILKERNYTLSELAAKTEMAAPTIKQHTSVLVESGLIELRDEGRKWKYYSLTNKGKKILESKEKHINILIILSSTIVVVLLGFAMIFAAGMFQTTNMMGEATSISDDRVQIVPPVMQKDDTPIMQPGQETENDMAEISNGAGIGVIIVETPSDSIAKKCVKIDERIEWISAVQCEDAETRQECEKIHINADGSPDCKWE